MRALYGWNKFVELILNKLTYASTLPSGLRTRMFFYEITDAPILVKFGTKMVVTQKKETLHAIFHYLGNLKEIFPKQDVNALHEIENPTGRERDKLQEVDELVAKAVSFHSVSKVPNIFGVTVL